MNAILRLYQRYAADIKKEDRNMTTTFLSKKGLKELKKSITKLEHSKDRVSRELKELDHGDSREDRLVLVEKLATLESFESELIEKRDILAHARQLPRRRDAIKVALGSVVDLIDTNGRIIRYQLVDSFEANPSDGRISAASPLGSQLLGRTLKEFVEWTAGRGTNRAQLVAIQ